MQAQLDDGYLDTDSEDDEFAQQDAHEEEGVAQWAPDDWEAASDDEDEDEEDMVRRYHE
jgi:hypothetical protein